MAVLAGEPKAGGRQERDFYGLLMAHFAIRGLMHEAACKADTDPDHLSYVHAVRVIRRKLPGHSAISPSRQGDIS